jgi:hypothetical protein
MNQKLIAAGLASLTLLGAGIAVAQPPAGGRHADVTRAELTQRLDARFARLDANGDGNLNAADRTAGVAARFKQLDSDGNGALSLAEFSAADAQRAGAFAGGGGDGGPAGRHRGGGRHGRGGPGGSFGGGPGARADANGDGNVSKAEFQSSALAGFDKADANHDGKLTAAERQATRAARHGPRAG